MGCGIGWCGVGWDGVGLVGVDGVGLGGVGVNGVGSDRLGLDGVGLDETRGDWMVKKLHNQSMHFQRMHLPIHAPLRPRTSPSTHIASVRISPSNSKPSRRNAHAIPNSDACITVVSPPSIHYHVQSRRRAQLSLHPGMRMPMRATQLTASSFPTAGQPARV